MSMRRKEILQTIEKSYKRIVSDRRFTPANIILILSGLFLIFLVFLLKDVPNPAKLVKTPAPISTKILDRNGKLLYEVYSEYRRTPITSADIPDFVKQATIAIEDKNFYKHHGLDTVAIIRAAINTLTGKRLEGGSTITQQLVKNSLLSDPRRTITRKIKEAILAIATEIYYSKDQILELYLNHAPYGGTVYGIETAAQTYFGKSAKELNLSESALLAGLPQSPTRYSPFGAKPELAINRQHEVLRRMQEDGYITSEQLESAKKEKLNFLKKNITINAPHFSLMVRDNLVQKYGEEKVNLGGLIVTTTLDLELQKYVEASLSAEMKKIASLKISNGAAIVTHPNTGEILTLVGSKDYYNDDIDGQVNVVTSLRQPGSSIKPINYATGLLLGWPTSTTYLDVPTCFNVAGQRQYCPKNYDNTFRGPVSMRQSLASSLNIPAVKQLALNGADSFIATASAMGISSWTDQSRYGLSLTLGGGEVTMYDMAKAFGTFANKGVTVPLVSVIKVETFDGQVLEEFKPETTANLVSVMPLNWVDFWKQNPSEEILSTDPRVTLPQEVTFIISDILADNGARSATFGTNSKLVIPGHTVSVKTGTTNDLKDNWTIGYTPDYLAATWVGNNDSTSMSYVASGVTGASPIWNSIMKKVLLNIKDKPLSKPEMITNFQVCNLTGLLAQQENQCESHSEYFIEGILPLSQNNFPVKKQVWVRRSDKYPILPGDETVDRDLEEHTVVSDPFSQDFCLDCAYPVDEKGHIQWPQTIVDYSKFESRNVTPLNYLPIPKQENAP
ncbi:MAG: Penicillin-binding protein, 1A family [Candidatus Collierbacteria bacterium GW2011_GWC2_43_12]|uniref:Penicillin-binding protein, 1A family n=2 Tax=Candidatus Collieribacteriota TaxID=1752725 RepID=A0A0G1G6B0_9BACT|nr:MAG: Penicillin-binding protein, 1A family [Candidatus Collierbacteria bacterium GW2011_GWC2_43_12]